MDDGIRKLNKGKRERVWEMFPVVGGRWSVAGGWWSVVGGRWLVDGGWWSVVGGRWPVIGGRWSVAVVGGWWSVVGVGGRWPVIGGRWSVEEDSVVRNFRTTAADGKLYDVAYYNLDMVLALGFRGAKHRGSPIPSVGG